MEFEISPQQSTWEAFSLSRPGRQEFLQSWEWGEFQKKVGNMPLRLQILQSGQVVGQIQGFRHSLPFGPEYLYLPRYSSSSEYLNSLLNFLKENFRFIFVRLEPAVREDSPLTSFPRVTVKNRQPKETLIVDLRKSGEELLSGMHAKTRYNIRLAEKKGIEIRKEKDIDTFWRLNEETTRRDKFKSHGREYYEKMLSSNFCQPLTAYYKGEPVAANLFVMCGNTYTYLHGASSQSHKEVMAPYLLQWEGMKLARERGCLFYDFWGIASSPKHESQEVQNFHTLSWDENHPLSRVTRFKAGFGGERIEYANAYEIVLRPRVYALYQKLKQLRGLFCL